MCAVQMTVLLATRNGEHVLPRTLGGYQHAIPPSVGWKLVVVDNGSSDGTPEILRSFEAHLPLHVLQQPIPGKNRCLNVGMHAVEGSLLILTDDDAVPNPTFLVAWEKYLTIRGDYELFGGRIDPFFEVAPPNWLKESGLHFRMMFAECGLPEGPVAPDDIYGPNMAVRASVISRGFCFDERLGPNASNPDYPAGGETEFCERVTRAGARCWFASEPGVHHIVRPHQLTSAYWVQRAYRLGRARAIDRWRRGHIENRKRPARSSAISKLCRWLGHQLAMLSPLPKQRFEALVAYHIELGFRDEWARQELNVSDASHNDG